MQNPLAAHILADIVQAIDDPVFFIHRFVKVGGEPVTLNSQQLKWLDDIVSDRAVDLGEDRASGRTTLLLWYAVWRFVMHSHSNIMYVTSSREMAKWLSATFAQMVDTLEISQFLVQKGTWNQNVRQNKGNGCIVYFSPITRHLGRGMTINSLLIDNLEGMPSALRDELFWNLGPALAHTVGTIITTGTDTEWGTYNITRSNNPTT